MEFPANASRSALMLVAGFLGTACAPGLARAQCPDTATVSFEGVVAASGKPFQAKKVTTIVTYENDGTKHVKINKSNLFRDSKGRLRVERFYDGTEYPSETEPADILVYDNCGTSVILTPSRQTAKITKKSFPVNESDRRYCEDIDLKNPPNTGPAGKFEDLGHKLIDGVEVRGERMSYYISAKAKLAGGPPVRVYENWCSISLDTSMGVYILGDNPKREITIVISDIRQIEPDSALFEIPEGYKITRADQIAPTPSAKSSPSGTSAPQ